MSVFQKLVLLFIAVAFTNHSYCREDYLRYHEEILTCERTFLFEHNISKALLQYRKVIASYSKPFAKDCFIALQLSCLTKDKNSARYFFKKSFERGVDWGACERSKWINALLHDDLTLNQEAEKMYAVQHEKFLRKINEDLRAEVIAMKNVDDSFKARYNGMPQNELRVRLKQEHLAVVDSNMLRIVQLTRKHGFLGDNILGFMDYGYDFTPYGMGNVEDVRKDYCYQLRSLIDQLYFHHGCCFMMLQPQMISALREGEILPGMYAMMYEWAYGDVADREPVTAMCTSIHEPQQKLYRFGRFLIDYSGKPFDTAFVEKCRLEIALPTIDHAARKKAYGKEHSIRTNFGMFDCY